MRTDVEQKAKQKNKQKSRRKVIADNSCKIIADNSGSITVETCLIMPIVLGVVVLAISLFLNLFLDSKISSNSYIKLYTYYEPELEADEAVIELSDKLTAGYDNMDVVTVHAIAKEGVVRLELSSSDKKRSGMYVYAGNKYKYNLEYNKCTPRLRRWQAFGDVIYE